MDTIVIDIETKNTFKEVGRDNFDALEISLIGLYSYNQNKYFAFEENELEKAAEFLKNTGLLIGFSISRFDLPVMKRYFSHLDNFDIVSIPRVDLLDEIEILLGRRVGLDILAKANLGIGKTGHGLEAPGLYREGKIKELKDYCLNDVKITKELYEFARNRGYLMIPQKESGDSIKVEFPKEAFCY